MNDNPLKARRRELGMTQAELAERCFVSPVVLNAWENDRVVPRIGRVKDIKSAYQVSTNVASRWIVELAARVARHRMQRRAG